MANKYGFFGPICNADWDDSDANVACVQLGFAGGVAAQAVSYIFNLVPIFIGHFACNGTESTLDDCTYVGVSGATGCSTPDENYYTNNYKINVAGILCRKHRGKHTR